MTISDKLNDKNYANWMRDIKVLLVEKGLWELVVGIETVPVTTDVKDTETKSTTSPGKSSMEKTKEFNQRCHVAFSIIYYNIELQMRALIQQLLGDLYVITINLKV